MPTHSERDPIRLTPAIRYVVAIAGVLSALLISWVLHPALDIASFLLSLAAVAAAAALAGARAGLLVTVLAILSIDFFFLAPQRTLRVVLVADALALVLFGAIAILVSWLMESIHQQRRRAERQMLEAAGLASLLERQLGSIEQEMRDRQRLQDLGRAPSPPSPPQLPGRN